MGPCYRFKNKNHKNENFKKKEKHNNNFTYKDEGDECSKLFNGISGIWLQQLLSYNKLTAFTAQAIAVIISTEIQVIVNNFTIKM